MPTRANLINVQGTLYFTAYTTAYGTELWRSNGTSAGTGIVGDIIAGSSSSNPSNLTVAGAVLYFTILDTHGNYRLWEQT